MHVFLLPHSLNQPEVRLWIRHILDIVPLVLMMKSRGGFHWVPMHILSISLQNLFYITVFDSCVSKFA
jgi:hypothetical protein